MEIRTAVKAGLNSIQDRDQGSESLIHCIYNRTTLGAAADVRLVANDY